MKRIILSKVQSVKFIRHSVVRNYPSVEDKAATLLYLVTKNHSFSDGNKRIAAMLFLWFMERNGILYRADGSKRIADNTLCTHADDSRKPHRRKGYYDKSCCKPH
ncbi:MAG: hypothetical protein E7080_00985 [Bacteroidales bacterium]|nr:hypothetical protein [Bacteroidales bacterium]